MSTHDLTLGPSEDGGYYLIGTRKHIPRVFEEIPWSSSAVFETTLSRAAEQGLDVHSLPKYFDIDTVAEYQRWKSQ